MPAIAGTTTIRAGDYCVPAMGGLWPRWPRCQGSRRWHPAPARDPFPQ